VLEVSNVVWCTGLTAGYKAIDLPLASGDGPPAHDRGVVESCPGLYLMGLLFIHTLSSALVGGVGRDAEHIVDHIAARAEVGSGRAWAP
jgi:putative flavoprotein involved in K+ transport